MFYSSMGLFFLDGQWNKITVYEDSFDGVNIISVGTVKMRNLVKANTKTKTLKILIDENIKMINNVKVSSLIEWAKKMYKDCKIEM